MFGFLNMMGNYEQRKVANYTPPGAEDWLVDTAAVTDAADPFETAVQHPDYNSGKMVIVETYKSKKLAQAGHDRWVKIMTAKKLPDSLTDVARTDIHEMAEVFGENLNETFKRIPKKTKRGKK